MDVHQNIPRGGGGSGSVSDWISATSSVIAGVVGLVTLLTVYVAAMQILSRRQLYRLGVSAKSLGRWKRAVVTPSLLRMQTQISTPTISLPRLVEKGWKPEICFPTGLGAHQRMPPVGVLRTPSRVFSLTGLKGAQTQVPSDMEALAEASWVNFLEALGLTPETTRFYEMQAESELVNGMVPMRWKGRDLVGICSMLGFQSHEDKPSARTPMPLPMQWSGPLGWLQFRASSDGCIVEYRRRGEFKDVLPWPQYKFYSEFAPQPLCLKSRLWQSINGLYLPNDRLLYIGGSNPMTAKLKERRENTQRSINDICDDVVASNRTDGQLMKVLWGKKENRPDTVGPGGPRRGPSQIPETDSLLPEFLRDMSNKVARKGDEMSRCLQVLKRSPGLLSMIVEGELASIRGLDLNLCDELHREYTDPDDVGLAFPHQLGRFRMNEELLKLLKDAVLLLKPDGFYFTPTKHLCSDVNNIWQHVTNKSEDLLHRNAERPEGIPRDLFPIVQTTKAENVEEWNVTGETLKLYHAMAICNKMQNSKIYPVMFTIADMVIISKASDSLRDIVTKPGKDIIWAMIVCHDLFSHMVDRFGQMDAKDLLKQTVNCKNGILDCTPLKPTALEAAWTFTVPLMGDTEFSGAQVLAALMDVFLTCFWVGGGWISDVAVYDSTVPQSVTMC